MSAPTAETLSAILLAATQMPIGEDRDRAIARAVDCAARHGITLSTSRRMSAVCREIRF